MLSDNILWDGTKDWVFGPGESGGTAIREREKVGPGNVDLIKELARIDLAVENFLRLLSSSRADDATVGSLYLHLSKKRLLSENSSKKNQLQVDDDPFLSLAQAKLMQAILEKYHDAISKNLHQVIGLVLEILQQRLTIVENEERRKRNLLTPSYTSLSNITQSKEYQSTFNVEEKDEDVLSVALSLLNSILSSSEFRVDNETTTSLEETLNVLNKLEQLSSSTDSEASKVSIQTTVALLSSCLGNDPNDVRSSTHADTAALEDVQQTLNLVMNDLASEAPPIRNSALHALQALIKTANLPLDVPTIALILLNVIRTDNEEFVYLAAIQTVVHLAFTRNFGFVTRLFVNAFQDVEEETGVDGRLRCGEMLATLTDELSARPRENKQGDIVHGIADVMIVVAGRRGERKREDLERQRQQRLQNKRKKEAERAWGGEIPEIPYDEDDDLTPLEKQKKLRDLDTVEKIVKGWEDTGLEEDVRIRASALSILGRLLENYSDSLTSALLNSAVDMALSILSLELGPEKAILRRSATLVLFSILKAEDTAQDEGKEINFGLDGAKWNDFEKVLSWVSDTDNDELTVGHAKAVLEGLEAWRMKSIAAASSRSQGISGSLSLDGRLKGLNFNPETSPQISRNLKVEEID